MDAPRPPLRAFGRILTAAILPLTPALLAIALIPEFVTQDGSSHLYNARVLRLSLGESSPFREAFDVRWQPLPNWAGHVLFVALDAAFPPDVADRLATATTLVVLALSVVTLRYVVAGENALVPTGWIAALLAMNVTWLFGFTSFLLGAALTPLTWAAWWASRDRIGFVSSFRLSVLLVLGYFCHPISLGLTVLGLITLECGSIASAFEEKRRRSSTVEDLRPTLIPGDTPPAKAEAPLPHSKGAFWTLLALLPLVPLGLMYLAMTREGGKLEPVWEHLGNPLSPSSWANQLGWVDPISLAGKGFRPFSGDRTPLNLLFAPVFWTVIGFVSSFRNSGGAGLRIWGILGALILAAGVLGPDTLGVSHGHYMPQRVVLIGFVSLIPWLGFGRVTTTCFGVALALQSAFVWDYALDCRTRGGEFLKAAETLRARPGERIGTLLTGTAGKFRSNPMLHLDTRIGLATNAVVLSDYETAHYYFPVRFREGDERPPARLFEDIARLDDPKDAPRRQALWADLLARYHDTIDWLVVVGGGPGLDEATGRWFEEVGRSGRVRTYRRHKS